MPYQQFVSPIQAMIDQFREQGIPLTGKCIGVNNCSLDTVEALEKHFGLRVAVDAELPDGQLFLADESVFRAEAFVTDYKYEIRD